MRKITIMSASVFLAACNMSDKVLENNDIWSFKVEAVAGADSLKLSGLCMHSNMVVKGMDEVLLGDTLVLKLKATALQKDEKSGSFNLRVKLQPHTNVVVLGNKHYEIWNRFK